MVVMIKGCTMPGLAEGRRIDPVDVANMKSYRIIGPFKSLGKMEERAAEVRMEMQWLASADVERRDSNLDVLDSEYDSAREDRRRMGEEIGKSEVARKAAIEAADKWKAANRLSCQTGSVVATVEEGNIAGISSATKGADRRDCESDSNVVKGVGAKKNVMRLPGMGTSSKISCKDQRTEEFNREHREVVANQSQSRDMNGAAVFPVLEDEDWSNGYSRGNGGVVEGSRYSRAAEEREVSRTKDAATNGCRRTDAGALRVPEVHEEEMDWSDWAEYELEAEKDCLSKAELLAEELYKDVMELQNRLIAEVEMDAGVCGCGMGGKEHSWTAETKETCGAIMYASSRVQEGRCGVSGEGGGMNAAGSSESRSLSFSHTSQSSDTLVPTVRMEVVERAGSAEPPSGMWGNMSKGHEAMNEVVKLGSVRSEMEEIERLRGSNARKQAKIESLQKWRAFYKAELEDRDAKLGQMKERYGRDVKKTERGVKKLAKAHATEVEEREAKVEGIEEKLRTEMKELNLAIEELSEQLYEMEEQLAGGRIPERAPVNQKAGLSPKALVSAAIGVKEAAHSFSRTFMSYLKQHLTKARDLDEQICLESEVIVARSSDYKYLVQSFVVRRMFMDFESECFNIESCMSDVHDTEEQTRACFEEYSRHKAVSETVMLLTDNRGHNGFLREFCFKKFLHIVSESTEEAFFGDFIHSDEICAGRHPSSRFYESYLKLAVSVWVLHRLAFSFDPPARMILVRKGTQFNPAYMESVVPGIWKGEESEGDGSSAGLEALVGLMVHPGFRCGTSIIPSQVYLVTK